MVIQVQEQDEAMRLDRLLRTMFPSLPHSHIARLIRKGQIRLDGHRCKISTLVTRGQSLRLPPVFQALQEKAPTAKAAPAKAPPTQASAKLAQQLQKAILYKNDMVIAINKPRGLAVQGGTRLRYSLDDTLEALAQNLEKEEPGKDVQKLRLVHRLDKETSGVLLLACHRKAAAYFGEVFRKHAIVKTYWGLVHGVPRRKTGSMRTPLSTSKPHQEARTEYQVIASAYKEPASQEQGAQEPATQEKVSWVVFTPHTGRRHQIRAHAALLGHPLVGDKRYGEKTATTPKGAIFLHLHAHSVQFSIPLSDPKDPAHPRHQPIKITAPLPDDMRQSWHQLGFDEKQKLPQP